MKNSPINNSFDYVSFAELRENPNAEHSGCRTWTEYIQTIIDNSDPDEYDYLHIAE